MGELAKDGLYMQVEGKSLVAVSRYLKFSILNSFAENGKYAAEPPSLKFFTDTMSVGI